MEYESQEMEKSQLVNEVLPDGSPEGIHERRLARYAVAKQRQELVSDFILHRNEVSEKKSLTREAKSLQECGSFLIFRHYFTLDMYKMVSGCTCKKHLLCALCAIRRAAKCIAMYSEKISVVEGDQAFDELMITFTIKHKAEDTLQDSFDHILTSMKRLLQKRTNSLKKNARTYSEMMHLSGAVYSYEVTFSVDNGFHPHCHMIALVPSGHYQYSRRRIKKKSVLVPQVLKDGIIEDWKQITDGSYIIDVRKIESTVMPEPGQNIKGSRLEALVEVFKYALKMNHIDKDSDPNSEDNLRLQVEAYETLKGRRMIGSFGSLWGVKIPDNLNDSPLTEAELPYVDLVYQYSGVNFGYQLTSHSSVQVAIEMPSRHHEKAVSAKYHKKVGDSKWKQQVKDFVMLNDL